ncbi:MAG: hypothetical protein QXU72_07610 [Thermofilum sp.]
MMKARPLPALAAFMLVFAVKPLFETEFNVVLYDYAIWGAAAFSLLTAAADFKLFWGRASIYSTLMLELEGLVLVAVGRLGSLAVNALYMVPFIVIPPLGGPYTTLGLSLSFWVFPGSLLIFASSALHALVGSPLELARGPTLAEVEAQLTSGLRSVASAVTARPWTAVLLAFLFAFAWRITPEILWWPWPVGWDTVEYMAHLLDFAEKLNPFTSYYWMGGLRNIPPLLDIVLLPAALAGHAWVAFKLYPPLAYATLAASTVLYAQRVLRLGWKASLLAGTLTALYFLNFRISWDYHRQLLGSIFLVSAVACLDIDDLRESSRSRLAAAALVVLAAMSHEVTAFAAIILSLAYVVSAMRRRDAASIATGAAALAASTALELWYWGFTRLVAPSEYTGVAFPGMAAYADVVAVTGEAASYLAAGYGLTLPFAALALARPGLKYTKLVLAALMSAGLSPLIAPYTAVTTWYRFLIGAAPLASTLAAAGLVGATKDRRIIAAYLLLVALPSTLNAFSLGQAAKYTSSLREVPSFFGPSPPSAEQLAEVAEYFLENPPGAPVLAENGNVARWVHLAVRNPTPSALIWDATPLSVKACSLLNSTGKLILVTFAELELDCGDLYLLKEGSFKIYLLQAQGCQKAENVEGERC